MMSIRTSALSLPILRSFLEPAEFDVLDVNTAVCFLQPEYTLVDHHNRVIEQL